MITTKRGKAGRPLLSFSTQLSASKISKEFPVLSGDQFRKLVKSIGTPSQIAVMGSANTDWQKEIYQTAITSDNNLSYSGSMKNMPYRIGAEYLSQTGVLKTDHLDRKALSISLTPNLFDDHLKIDINLHGSSTDSRNANTGAIGNAVSFDPTQPVHSGKANFGGLLGLILLNGLFSIIGVLCCFVGVYFYLPVALAAQAVAYRRIFPEMTIDFSAPTPPPPPANWA